VLRTLDRLEVRVDLAFVQEVLRVAADRVDRSKPLVAEVHHRDQSPVHGETLRLTRLGDVGDRADPDPRHHADSFSVLLSSSSWIALSAPSRTSSIFTRSSTSWKNPATIRRSASARGIPRLVR